VPAKVQADGPSACEVADKKTTEIALSIREWAYPFKSTMFRKKIANRKMML